MTLATDIYENTSEDLSSVILKVLNNEEISQPAKLASVRKALQNGIEETTTQLDAFSTERLQELLNEVDALIEEYGDYALAMRFFKPRASQALTQLIEAGIDKLGEPTLSQLFNELEHGLLANLISDGELDDDEAQTVTAELQTLIEKHGADAIAEEFVRYL